ncbi:Transcriptional regulator [Flavobacterium sp. 9AF]|uniref:glycosyltransferase n=1 Tax=Flavobacterium sp. 9AF TaxID=2653142 RepID=UPI0012F2A05A|nr:glycosyltransferase [Flavobacterium sp. 9AF]VXB21240.1 Transcriptional regulator [Flavobacterium sp. 9AF]
MKILIIDDQELVLLSLEKCLIDLGYEVITAKSVNNGILKYENHLPDLVIVDINIPENENEILTTNHGLDFTVSGLDVVEHIKVIRGASTPVMILSGNTDESIIQKGFVLGVEDYMKKPISLTEIGLRVKHLIGSGSIYKVEQSDKILQKMVVGVVIPCYNEEKRLQTEIYKKFVEKNLGYHLCFVNDGSNDSTLDIVNQLAKDHEDRISVLNCEKNVGKAEAVRLGMVHLAKNNQYDYIGFLDADLSTNFDDFQDLVNTISNSNFQLVSGSRMRRMGANITKQSSRAIISKTVNYIIRKTVMMEINDTQCGAKIMTREIIQNTFQTKFLTKWLFDVEIFMRMKKAYGTQKAKELICEMPLKRWIHADGSKLSMKDSVKIIGQIGQIALNYK